MMVIFKIFSETKKLEIKHPFLTYSRVYAELILNVTLTPLCKDKILFREETLNVFLIKTGKMFTLSLTLFSNVYLKLREI